MCDSNQDDNDILRQMGTVYAKSNTLLRTFSHCSTDVKVTFISKLLHCIVFSGVITGNQHIRRFVLHLIMRIEQSLVFPKGVVPVLCMLFPNHNNCNFETTIRKSIIRFYTKIRKHQ